MTMTENLTQRKKTTKICSLNLRKLRLSLKYRPEILKLILKMRRCIIKKNSMLKKLKLLTSKDETKADTNSLCTQTDAVFTADISQVDIIGNQQNDEKPFLPLNILASTADIDIQTNDCHLIKSQNVDTCSKNHSFFKSDEGVQLKNSVQDLQINLFSRSDEVVLEENSYDVSKDSVEFKKDSVSQTNKDVPQKECSDVNKVTGIPTIDSFSQTDEVVTQKESDDVNNDSVKHKKDSFSQTHENAVQNEFCDVNEDLYESKNYSCSQTDKNVPQKESCNIDKDANNLKKDVFSQTDEWVQQNDSCDIRSKTECFSQTDETFPLEDSHNINKDTDKSDKDLCSETNNLTLQKDECHINKDSDNKDGVWVINTENGKQEKSIADQVKEVAQSAMEQSGMVYVESAGMYYDYKTGYYYNSDLGLYYHTDTGCYYYYSDDKQTFVFHSYPETGAANKKYAQKHKKARKIEDSVENLTKTFSQGNQEDETEVSKPKRRKKEHKKRNIQDKSNKESKSDSEDKVKTNDKNIDSDLDSNDQTDVKEDNVAVQKNVRTPHELEDGECSDTDSEKLDCGDESDCSTSTASDDETVSKHHPPCMRVIVRETKLPKLKVGSLFMVTKDGGTVGREGEQHAILLKDHNVSRNHLDIRYDMTKQMYVLTDLGSKNGTILNGFRVSESQIISEPMEVMHGSTIQLGETKLLCHIHPGNDTCGHCEPGLLLHDEQKIKVAYTRNCDVKRQHQLELARLKNKYAPELLSIEEGTYNDRAKARRETVGSSHNAEKTQASDVDTFIEPENKGFKLLEKMGWSKGEGLGKESQGGTEPIPLITNEGKAGLGAPGASAAPPSAPFVRGPSNTLGPATLRLAARTKMLQPPAKAFQNTQEEDSE